ncbi:HEAT repeat domain-containing protein [Paenibacillus thiaminolyticus]|uniref:HEAT repeat domain-containing protein n=1 Tax=Paenibacillus thiaminolyticus TaxID=49283 RepID=UPI0023507DE0|nr:HEAT repeat domain-containing protein [Paenibacillus thiaminolyticus]WCR28697.1 HEAT repeat domain-containing protein [Paenibacillus thiaminolyticus]
MFDVNNILNFMNVWLILKNFKTFSLYGAMTIRTMLDFTAGDLYKTRCASLEQSLDWGDLKKDYPMEADIDTQHLEDDRKCIDELNVLLHSNQLDDDYRVQERACEILGYRRHVPAKEKLREIAQSGMPNGRQAAKGALAKIRETGETSK